MSRLTFEEFERPLLQKRKAHQVIDLGDEDSWSEEQDKPEDSEEEEYLTYGAEGEASYTASLSSSELSSDDYTLSCDDEDGVVQGMDEDYTSDSSQDSNKISDKEVKHLVRNALDFIRKGKK